MPLALMIRFGFRSDLCPHQPSTVVSANLRSLAMNSHRAASTARQYSTIIALARSGGLFPVGRVGTTGRRMYSTSTLTASRRRSSVEVEGRPRRRDLRYESSGMAWGCCPRSLAFRNVVRCQRIMPCQCQVRGEDGGGRWIARPRQVARATRFSADELHFPNYSRRSTCYNPGELTPRFFDRHKSAAIGHVPCPRALHVGPL